MEQSRHLDSNPGNNRLENLKWGWPEEDRIKHGVMPKGETYYLAKLTEVQVKEIRKRVIMGEKQLDLAKEFNVSRATICNIFNNKVWKD